MKLLNLINILLSPLFMRVAIDYSHEYSGIFTINTYRWYAVYFGIIPFTNLK